jgi:hypothetical protein
LPAEAKRYGSRAKCVICWWITFTEQKWVSFDERRRFDRTGFLGNAWTSYPGGASLVYYAGSVRGVQQTNPLFDRPCVGPPVTYNPMSNPKSTFYPHFDGIFNYDQYDHDDVTYMQSHLSWALRQ